MKRLTRTQGQALVHLVATFRRDWQPAGIEAAIRKAAEDAPGPEVAVAAVRVATDPEARTPGLIPAPGPHWQGTSHGRRQPPPKCPHHPDQPVRCPTCRAEATPPPPNWRRRTTTTATKEEA